MRPPSPEERRRQTNRGQVDSRLRQVLESYEPGLGELAKRLGWPLSKLSKLKHGKQTPSLPDLIDIAEAVGLAVSDLLHPSHVSNLHVPVESYPVVPLDFLGNLNDHGLAVLRETWGGPTMMLPKTAPRAIVTLYSSDGFDRYIRPPQSHIVVDPEQKDPVHGGAYLILLPDGQVLMREYRGDHAPRWVANSLARVDDMFVSEHFCPRVIGQVMEVIIHFRPPSARALGSRPPGSKMAFGAWATDAAAGETV
jgi:hypothetical protein